MSMLYNRRLQVLLDEGRYRRLETVAGERGVSVATVVRDAIDRGLGSSESRKRAAGRRLLEAPGMPVGDPPELRTELDALRSGQR
jgi:hypothetical protein